MIKKIVFPLMLLVIVSQISAQTFTNKRDKFIKEMENFLTTFNPVKAKALIKDLEPFVVDGQMSEAHFQKMVETCNLMTTKHMQAFPEMYNYVLSVYSLDKNASSEDSYKAWQGVIDEMLNARSTRRFGEFIKVCGDFLSTRMFYSSTNYECYFRGEFLFKHDKSGPMIEFKNGTLSCLTVNNNPRERKKTPYIDSMVIENTSAIYDPMSEKWLGKGGKVTWEKVGLPANETWAELNNYKFSVKRKNYNCDSVTLHTPRFEKPLKGTFSDRTMNFTREVDKKYPHFISYNKDLLIKNIIPNVDYVGGFALDGAVFVGVGTQTNLAEVKFYKDKAVFATAESQEFSIDEKGLIAENASIKIMLGLEDSITHSGLYLRFTKNNNTLEFSRGKTGVSQSPFSDSYHKLDMYVDKILWNRDENKLVFTWSTGVAIGQRMARFESKNFFDERLYDAIQGMSQVHPLVALHKYAYKYDMYTMKEGRAATALGRTIEQAKPLMLQLANDGFIAYDYNRGVVEILPKVENYIQFKAGRKDYDNINFICDFSPKKISNVSKEEFDNSPELQKRQAKYDKENKIRQALSAFGEMDLETFNLKLQGVDRVGISSAQQTAVFPDSAEVIVKRNRDFYFNGWVNSGKWILRIKDGSYNYDANKISIPYSDFASMRINPLKEEDGKRPIQLDASISGIQGELLIDDPGNRSGVKQKQFPTYPKLISKTVTKVFYNSPGIQNGAYDSSRFYFAVSPFEFDSLDNFYEKNLSFKGELISAGIFPKFKQELKIMPDYSLGFSTVAPTNGYDFYETGAMYKNKIVLSNNGLQGAGTINYLTATAISNAFTFLPDSTTGVGKFNNKPRETGIQMPDVHSDEAFMIYSPKNKVLSARSMQKPLYFFNDEGKFRGEAFVRPTGMTGAGIFDFNTALVGSYDFTFDRWDMNADSSFFQLIDKDKSHPDNGIAFKTSNVSAHVSMKERKGVFKSNEGESIVEFPVNEYICKMDIFTWFMDKSELELSKTKEKSTSEAKTGIDLAGTNFISTNAEQDSLRFGAGKARFVLNSKTIFCDQVEYIDVADARIYPDSMKVTIRKHAKMDPLENSRIVANYVTKYHQIINATTQIKGRRDYVASGDYPYYDIDSTLTLVKIDKVYLDDTYQTVAEGNIPKEKSFKLSPQFEYYGKITMHAATPKLKFDGATRIIHNCTAFSKSWMSFSAEIDPKNIQIPVGESMTSLDGKSLSAGIVWHFSDDLDSTIMYPTFLSEMVASNDVKVITASGWLQYNQGTKEFEIASREKLDNRALVGNYISLHTKSCSMNGNGKVNIGMDYGDMKVESVGVVNYNQNTKATTMNLTVGITTPMDKSLFKNVADKILLVPELKPTNLGFTTLESAVATWSSQKDADKFKSDYTLKGEVGKIPGCDEYTFVLSNVKLKSLRGGLQEKGLVSTENTADLVSIYGQPILKNIPMQLAFYKPPVAETYRMGLNLDLPGNTYFLNYEIKKKDGMMKIYTTDPDLTTAITAMKPEKKKVKKFTYDITTNSSLVSMFKRLFE